MVSERGSVFVSITLPSKHHIPLRPILPPSRDAGVLYEPSFTNSENSFRIVRERRGLSKHINRVIDIESTIEPFATPVPDSEEWRRPSRDIQYRQPSRGWFITGAVTSTSLPKPLTRSRPPSVGATPQFALAEGKEVETVEDTYESVYLTRSALAKRSPHISAVNVQADIADKLYEKAGGPVRKVLNTERYNNGSWVPLVARRGGARGGGGARGAKAVRQGIRALLAASGGFYAVALIAFYFLSLA